MQNTEFHWFSSLGISVILFLIYGAVYVLIGMLTPIMLDPQSGTLVFFSPNTDAKLFGQEPAKLIEGNKNFAMLRQILLFVIAGLLTATGIFHLALTWFGLRQGHAWALAAL